MKNDPEHTDCTPWRELLSAHLDGELTEREAADLAPHLADCAACRAELVALEELRDVVAADLRELRAEAPSRPMGLPASEAGAPIAQGARVESRPIPMPLRVAAAALFLLFVGAWLLDGTDSGLRARAAEVAAELSRPGTRYLVHARPPEELWGATETPARPEEELVHLFAHGPRGAYLWQLANGEAGAFDPDRYLVGSDGAELWTWDPELGSGRTLPVQAVPEPLPRALAQLFTDLEVNTLTSMGEVRGRGPWREIEVPIGSEPGGPEVRFLFTDEDELLGLEILPRPDLAVFVELVPTEAPLENSSFALLTHTGMDPSAVLALEPPEQPQPDVLWQLGYTPGAPPATWPEQLSALATELGALGYL